MKARAVKLIASVLRKYPFRGKTVLWNLVERKLAGEGILEVRFPLGYLMALDMSNVWQRHMAAGCLGRRMEWLVRHLLRPGDTFIDVGANCGYYTCIAAASVKHGSVHAFEPHPAIAAELQRQVKLNPGLNVTAHTTAVADIDGEITLFLPPGRPEDGGWHSMHARTDASLLFGNQADWTPHKSSCVTLDKFIQSNGIKRVELCKIDVEGSELAAIRGARKSLSSGTLESLIIEVSGETGDQLAAELERYAFELIIDITTMKPLRHLRQIGQRQTDVLLARGAGAERWRGLPWIKRLL